jgi:hypothetical protein
MDLQRAQDELLVRYYQWACGEWDAELADSFARIKRTRTRAAEEFLGAIARLRPEKVGVAIRAATKRAHPDGSRLVGEEISPEERQVLAEVDIYRRTWSNKQPSERGMPFALRGQVVPLLKEHLRELGKSEALDAAEWRYVADVHGWTLHTYVDFGGRNADLTYEHYLLASASRVIPCSISLLSWLGISRTKWRIANDADVNFAAGQIVKLSRYFMEALPGVTRGVRVES